MTYSINFVDTETKKKFKGNDVSKDNEIHFSTGKVLINLTAVNDVFENSLNSSYHRRITC